MRVVIADGHAFVRAELRLLLESQAYVEVVGEAGDAAETLAQVRALKPDVVLLDIMMGANGGCNAQEQIAKTVPETNVLVLTMNSDPAYVRTAMLRGAAGYVSKKTARTELPKALRVIRAGKRYVDPTTSHGLYPATRRKGPGLSQREEQVLLLIASGHSYKEIAGQMSVSVKTVETYRARIMKKLELKSRAELVHYAIDSGLLGRNTL